MTGSRRAPVDHRRVRGAHRGLKKLLVEGLNGGERSQPWKDFWGAMSRQSVDEAMNSLPAQHNQVVKLAYVSGLSNREIAEQMGMPLSGVRRRLREALATLSEQLERGRTAGRRVVYGIVAWLMARSIFDWTQRSSSPAADHVMQAAAALTVSVVAAALLAANPASPAQHTQTGGGSAHAAPAEKAGMPSAPLAPMTPATPVVPAAVVPASGASIPTVGTSKVPPLPANVSVPVNLPLPVPTPPIDLPKLPKL